MVAARQAIRRRGLWGKKRGDLSKVASLDFNFNLLCYMEGFAGDNTGGRKKI